MKKYSNCYIETILYRRRINKKGNAMRKIIAIFIFSLLLLADTNSSKDKYMFPKAFMKDNDLTYNKDDVVWVKPKKKKVKIKKVKKKKIFTDMNMSNMSNIRNMRKMTMAPISNSSSQNTKSMVLMYIAPTFSKRKNLKLIGVGLGFLINDWLNTELLAETSLKDNKLQIYDITNEYSINLLGTKYLRANVLTAFSAGGVLDKKSKVEKFFFAYGGGAEVELVIKKVKIVGAYKFEIFERKNTKAVKSSVYSVKMKFNFPF